MNKNHRLNAILIIGLILGFGFTIAVVSAAPPITVTSAVPAEAEQGTTNLTVIINGRGFDKNMDVKFCRSETNETCVDGGVDVEPGSVEFISSKQLKVTVDVGVNANIGNNDIEVESLSSRRRGRGIEKFAVLKAGGGGGGDTYSLTFSGALPGGSNGDTYLKDTGNGIGGVLHGNLQTRIDLTFFAHLPAGTNGHNCFGGGVDHTSDHTFNPWGVSVRQGRRGRAEATVIFRALTGDPIDPDPAVYSLHTVGFFESIPSGWPPEDTSQAAIVTLTSWEMLLNNHNPSDLMGACLSDGVFSVPNTGGANDWLIDVSLDLPLDP